MGEGFNVESGGLYGQITFEQVIFSQLMRIGFLSSNIFETASGEWQRNALNYFYAVKGLEAMVAPYFDDKYQNTLNDIEIEAKAKYSKLQEIEENVLTKPSKFYHVISTIDITNKILKLITEHLKQMGLLISPSVALVADEEYYEVNKEKMEE